MNICDYWAICKNGISSNECKLLACSRRNDILDEFELKEKE